MSNEEKKRIAEYMKRRAKWILIQMCVFVCLTVVFVGLVFIYQNIDKTYYITYKENSSIDYKVKLKDNNIYQEEYLGEEYSYVSSVVDNNSATSEETAAVSEEQKAQVDTMVSIMESFSI